MWWNVASANGSETARKNRDFVADNMTDDQIAEAQKLALESAWLKTTKTADLHRSLSNEIS